MDTARNLVYVIGQVPGNAGGFVEVVDAVKGPHFPSPPPFPTYFPKEGEEGKVIYAPASEADPLMIKDFEG